MAPQGTPPPDRDGQSAQKRVDDMSKREFAVATRRERARLRRQDAIDAETSGSPGGRARGKKLREQARKLDREALALEARDDLK